MSADTATVDALAGLLVTEWESTRLWVHTVEAAVDEALAPKEITITQLIVLHIIAARPTRMKDVAAAAGLSPSGLTRLVDNLVVRGWVRRTRDTDDGRGCFAVITPDGLEAHDIARPVYLAAVQAATRGGV